MVGAVSVLIGSINRQLNAAINLHMRLRFGCTVKWEGGRKKRIELRMESASQRREWWDHVVLPSLLVGGCVLTRGGGAE